MVVYRCARFPVGPRTLERFGFHFLSYRLVVVRKRQLCSAPASAGSPLSPLVRRGFRFADKGDRAPRGAFAANGRVARHLVHSLPCIAAQPPARTCADVGLAAPRQRPSNSDALMLALALACSPRLSPLNLAAPASNFLLPRFGARLPERATPRLRSSALCGAAPFRRPPIDLSLIYARALAGTTMLKGVRQARH